MLTYIAYILEVGKISPFCKITLEQTSVVKGALGLYGVAT